MNVSRKLLISLPNRGHAKGSAKEMIEITPDPAWMKEFRGFIQPYQDKVVNSRIFRDINKGTLTVKQFQGALINFFPLIESFPQYMALNLAKVPPGDSKRNRKAKQWLISNMNIERLHTVWWKHFAAGFNVPAKVLEAPICPPPEMDAINNYLWRICTRGSLAEGISASNFAIEGPTGEWTKNVKEAFEKYRNVEGLRINERTLEWIQAHASYDDKHPVEALEIIKSFATSKEEQEKVKYAAKRALEYYALALDACYELFK
ncbi:MAG: iron-containing redox enzyme family protein [Acidobacteria bacterium]|nr:iron-containing redox enzyme family protein [Acidobacteriota bacterium]